ncbi:hypothetical protein CALVIDRAFT_145168 [Calocera viscosa TUFC12733]|uniref:Homeobox domain-containing protein n=1 Tax=Calocera viscosa (strain TUFC12733) TaxID=1330018 RepID=A0A167LSP5_CALVF|nr:hypothetical protein CALVIDRAFT_145168 [Calocera viscosa TUFC12733]
MAFPSEDRLSARLTAFEGTFLDVITRGGAETEFISLASELRAITDVVGKSLLEGVRPYSDSLYAHSNALAARVIMVGTYLRRITQLSEEADAAFRTKLTALLPSSNQSASQGPDPKLAASQSNNEFAALRRWFLEHIDNPYPDRSQKRQLQQELGLSLQSINQFFTNARRRSGWMDFVKKYPNGSSAEAAILLRAIKDQEDHNTSSTIHIPGGARDAFVKIREYVSIGLDPEIRDGLEEAMNEELRRIEEDKARLVELGAVLEDGVLPKRKKAKTTPSSRPSRHSAPMERSQNASWPTLPSSTAGLSRTQTSPADMSTSSQTSGSMTLPPLYRRENSLTSSGTPERDLWHFFRNHMDSPSVNISALDEDVEILEPETGRNEGAIDLSQRESVARCYERTPSATTSLQDILPSPVGIPQAGATLEFASGSSGSHHGGPINVTMPMLRNWNQTPRHRNIPSEISRPTWSTQPAVSSTPKAKRRAPRTVFRANHPLESEGGGRVSDPRL